MSSVLQLYVDMLRMRARPQDLPASDGLLLASIVAAAVATTLAIGPFYPTAMGAARVGLDLVLQGVIVLAALRLTGRPERFRQTFSAICGTGAIFTLLAWPLYVMLVGAPTGEPPPTAVVLLVLALYVWATIVLGHIFRHAFDLRLGFAVGLALLYVIITTVIGESLLPPPEMN